MARRLTIAGRYDSGAAHVARRRLLIAGQVIEPGQPVDLGRTRRGRQLFESRRIVPAPAVEPEVEVEDSPTRTLHHRGGGYYDVLDADGNPVNESALRREEAEKLLEPEAVDEAS